MNSKSNKTCDLHRLSLDHTDKIGLKRNDIYTALSNFNMHYIWKKRRKSYNNKFKISAPNRKKNSNYLMDHVLYQIFKFEYNSKKHREETENPSKIIYVNKTENRIMFKTKTGYYLKLLILETMKLLGSTKNKITKIKMVKVCLI